MSTLELDQAELMRERHQHAEAERLYSRVLAALGPAEDRRRMTAHRGRASSRYRIGLSQPALEDFDAARALARKLHDAEAEVEILLEKATALDWANDAPAARQAVEQASSLALAEDVRGRRIRAALLVGRGRALFREGRWAEATELLEEAVKAAEQLGAAAHDELVIALLLLEVSLPGLGRVDEAEAAAERAIALTRANGDLMNLASALNNRRVVLVARGRLQDALSDQQQFRDIGKQLGLVFTEYAAEFNMAELLYQSGDLSGAGPHAARALGLEAQHPSLAARPLAALLHARLLVFQGLLAEARNVLADIEGTVKKARSEGRPAGLLTPSEDVLAAMIDLSTRPSAPDEWEALLKRSLRDSLEQEPLEVLEMRALAALRSGERGEAQTAYRVALEMANRIPNVMVERLKKGELATA